MRLVKRVGSTARYNVIARAPMMLIEILSADGAVRGVAQHALSCWLHIQADIFKQQAPKARQCGSSIANSM